jgi:ribosomal protein S1
LGGREEARLITLRDVPKYFKRGQGVKCMITRIDAAKKDLDLSIKVRKLTNLKEIPQIFYNLSARAFFRL